LLQAKKNVKVLLFNLGYPVESVWCLSDRTNGRAYTASVRRLSVALGLCIVAKRCVVEQKLIDSL